MTLVENQAIRFLFNSSTDVQVNDLNSFLDNLYKIVVYGEIFPSFYTGAMLLPNGSSEFNNLIHSVRNPAINQYFAQFGNNLEQKFGGSLIHIVFPEQQKEFIIFLKSILQLHLRKYITGQNEGLIQIPLKLYELLGIFTPQEMKTLVGKSTQKKSETMVQTTKNSL